MDSIKHPGNSLLLALFFIQAGANWAALQIESSVQMAYVFLVPIPFLMCASVLAAQLLTGQQLFLWRAVGLFFLAMALIAFLNLTTLARLVGSI